jgi:tRNA pseudouridine55 synthase
MKMLDGILLIDKPKNWTSFDAVARVRGVLRKAAHNQLAVASDPPKRLTDSGLQNTSSKKIKVGHTGTLDPLATGLLVLVLGSYTKRAGEFSKLDKTYEVTMRLGQTSTTGVEEGEKIFVSDKEPTELSIKKVMEKFIGETEQVPPAYSAVKVDGQRAYKLARKGQKVDLKSRKVTIYEIKPNHKIDNLDAQGRTLSRDWYTYPEVKFTARVSSGTYIRTLVEDIGKKLGTGAYTSDLRRIKVGKFNVENSISLADLNIELIEARIIDSM